MSVRQARPRSTQCVCAHARPLAPRSAEARVCALVAQRRRHHHSIYDLATNGRIENLQKSPGRQTDSENHESLVKTARARDFSASFARHESGPTEWDSIIDLLARDERHKDSDEDLTIDADSEPTVETDSSDF